MWHSCEQKSASIIPLDMPKKNRKHPTSFFGFTSILKIEWIKYSEKEEGTALSEYRHSSAHKGHLATNLLQPWILSAIINPRGTWGNYFRNGSECLLFELLMGLILLPPLHKHPQTHPIWGFGRMLGTDRPKIFEHEITTAQKQNSSRLHIRYDINLEASNKKKNENIGLGERRVWGGMSLEESTKGLGAVKE